MELTGAAEAARKVRDEKSERWWRKVTRRGSVGVERPVRTTSRNRPPEHAECTVSGAFVRVWKSMNQAEKEKALELLRERKGTSVGVSSMIAEIHGPFVKPQAITPIGSEARAVELLTGRQTKDRKNGK